MSMEMKTFLFCVCWVVTVSAFAWLLVQRRLDKQTIAEKDKIIEGLKDFNCRLMHELYKEKGISGPFVMPAEEPGQGPDFDVNEVFPANAECETQNDPSVCVADISAFRGDERFEGVTSDEEDGNEQ